jgi:lipoprotein NlpD
MNMWRWIALFSLPLLAACASHPPAPVVERGTAMSTASAAAPESAALYTVKKGDTLYGIALDHGLDYKDVAAWNNLGNANVIKVGQQLRLEPLEAAASGAVAKPVTAAGTVEARPLGAAAGNNDTLKRQPRGGTLNYSDQALAQAQAMDGAPAEKPGEKPADKPIEKPVAVTPAVGDEGLAWAWPAAGPVAAQFVEAAPGKESNKGIDLSGKPGDSVVAAGAGTVSYVGSGLRGYGQLVVIRHNATYLSVYAHNSKIVVKEKQTVDKGQKIAEVGSSDTDRPKLHFEIRRQGKPVDPLKYLPAR